VPVGLCDDLAIPRPLGALQDLAGHLPEPLAQVIRGGTDPRDLLALLVQELRCCQVPTVLVLEDVHWADEATLDAINARAGLSIVMRCPPAGGETAFEDASDGKVQ
jgi:hypothetical protein